MFTMNISFCDPCRIQTCNPHIRSVVLYSVELTDHASFRKRVQRYYKKFIYANFLKEKCKKHTFFVFLDKKWRIGCI